MPELPEVENIAQGLRREITGLSIKSIYVKKPIIRGPYRRRWKLAAQKLSGRKITGIARRGKRLILFTNSNLSILIQLGMTGKFLLRKPSTPREKHAHFYINLSKNKQLRFVDARRFGRVWFIENFDPACEAAGLSKMGPEPFDISAKQFNQIIARQRVIKNLLLDQTRIAGLGNIYADESLFAARIHPETSACDINSKQANKLRTAIKSILTRAIAHGGTTFSDFRNAYGEMGRFKKLLKVYQRHGLPCPRCKTPIARLKISGRSSHFCPKCQVKK